MVKMQITQTIQQDYRTQIATIVSRHVAGDYSDTLTRFSYINGVEDFLRFIQSPDYFGYSREIALIGRIVEPILQRIRNNSQIIDLGPGNGQKAMFLMSAISSRVSEYLALDMSQQMLNVARLSQDVATPNMNREYVLHDFSNMSELGRELARNSERDRIFLLLGNTLTNEVNMDYFLQNFREIVNQTNRGNNYLLLGIELLAQDINQIVREYRSEENYILTFRPLEALGVNRHDGIIDISFNEEVRRIEEQFIFTRPTTIIVNSHRIHFEEDSRVLLSVTYKPVLDEIMTLIRNAGWNIESLGFEENQAMLLLSSRNNEVEENGQSLQ